jgi:hypothetical protein
MLLNSLQHMPGRGLAEACRCGGGFVRNGRGKRRQLITVILRETVPIPQQPGTQFPNY